MAKYDTYKYQIRVGRKIVHGGITDDLERREQEHQQKWPKAKLTQVGRRTTEKAAQSHDRCRTTVGIFHDRKSSLSIADPPEPCISAVRQTVKVYSACNHYPRHKQKCCGQTIISAASDPIEPRQ